MFSNIGFINPSLKNVAMALKLPPNSSVDFWISDIGEEMPPSIIGASTSMNVIMEVLTLSITSESNSVLERTSLSWDESGRFLSIGSISPLFRNTVMLFQYVPKSFVAFCTFAISELLMKPPFIIGEMLEENFFMTLTTLPMILTVMDILSLASWRTAELGRFFMIGFMMPSLRNLDICFQYSAKTLVCFSSCTIGKSENQPLLETSGVMVDMR